MRDPERIDRMIGLLSKLWHEHEDWRLGQLVFNAADRGLDDPYGMSRMFLDTFVIEDDVMERGIHALLNRKDPNP